MVGVRNSLALMIGFMISASAFGADIQIKIENLQGDGGFFFTPVWVGAHDGSFDLFDMGVNATTELATIAETGDAAPLSALFGSSTSGNDTVVTAPEGFGGAPVFDTGDMAMSTLTVDDPMTQRYLSFASMVIPSNDAFFGNGDPMAYPIFHADGTFAGPITIDIMGSDIYDAGSELNDGLGAAFSAIGGTDTDESVGVSMHAGLDNFVGTDTAAGTTISMALANDAPFARITISAVPEPSSLSLGVLGFLGLLARRRG